jgi:hypothetical protein
MTIETFDDLANFLQRHGLHMKASFAGGWWYVNLCLPQREAMPTIGIERTLVEALRWAVDHWKQNNT